MFNSASNSIFMNQKRSVLILSETHTHTHSLSLSHVHADNFIRYCTLAIEAGGRLSKRKCCHAFNRCHRRAATAIVSCRRLVFALFDGILRFCRQLGSRVGSTKKPLAALLSFAFSLPFEFCSVVSLRGCVTVIQVAAMRHCGIASETLHNWPAVNKSLDASCSSSMHLACRLGGL